jgi:TonB family protein
MNFMSVVRVVLAAFVAALPGMAAAQGPVSMDRARDLYYSAAFEEALNVLDDLKRMPQIDPAAVEEYRAASLLALGRDDEAQHALRAMVRLAPERPAEQLNASPALRTAYVSVRERVLVEMVREDYQAAKAAIEGGRPADAARQFTAVLRTFAALPAHLVQEFADFRTLSSGFLDLIYYSQTAVGEEDERIYSDADPNVIGPAIIRQTVPQPPDLRRIDFSGTALIEIRISTTGSVESVDLQQGIHPAYDDSIVNAARTWRYHPATLNGQPVRFRKELRIDVR